MEMPVFCQICGEVHELEDSWECDGCGKMGCTGCVQDNACNACKEEALEHIKKKKVVITIPDKSVWEMPVLELAKIYADLNKTPVEVIAWDLDNDSAGYTGGAIEEAMQELTWQDLKDKVKKVKEPGEPDYFEWFHEADVNVLMLMKEDMEKE